MDYDAIAKKYGGQADVDYGSIASKYGGTLAEGEQPTEEKPKNTLEEAQRQTLAEMNWLQRQAVGAGGAMMRGVEGIKSLIPGIDADKDVIAAADVAAQEAPIGAIVGEVAKYAPTIPLTGIKAAMGASALLGAAYDPTGKRLSSGMLEGLMGGAGAAVGKSLPYLSAANQQLGERVRQAFGGQKADSYYGSLDRAREVLQKLMGGRADEASIALANAGDVTTAQALESVPDVGRRMAVLDNIARSEKGIQSSANPLEAEAYYASIAARQKAAKEGALNQMAMGNTAEQTAQSISQMGKRLERNLGPVREAALGEANIGRNVDELLKKADELDYQAMQFGGTSSQADALRQQAKTITDWGYSPLSVSGITKKISEVIDDPALGSSERVSSVMQDVAGGIGQWVKKGEGTIDANALYMKRKEAVNESVDKLLAGADPAVTKKLSAKLAGELKPLIDDAIEASGASGWKDYIKAYSKGFEQMDRVELLGKLRDLPENEFMKVVKGERPDVVQAIMSGKQGIADALPKSTLDRLQGIVSNMERDINLGQMAKSKEATAAVTDVLDNKSITRHLPNLLNRYVVLANTAVEAGEMQINKGMYRELDKAMRDPQAMKRLIEMLPPEQRNVMIGFAKQLGKGGTAAGAAYGETVRK